MASHANQQYYADGEYIDKQAREFQPTMAFKAKVDSIEEGAQVNVIEDVKVNGTSLPVDDKAVDISVPLVIDNLYTVDGSNALSAKQGKVLYDLVQNLQSRGRYLSNWNTATGLPVTNPEASPYPYKVGDYYIVSNVAAEGATNYRPNGSEFIVGQASSTVETSVVKVTDMYLYDGTNWNLLINSTREIPIDSALSTSSTNPVENRVVTNAINSKQDKLIAGTNIQIANDGKTISATDTTYTAGANINIDANNEISATDTTYTAGANVQISNSNVISATDTTYSAGDNIAITNNTISATYTAGTGIDITNGVITNTQTSAEWGNITGTLSDQTDLQSALNNKQDKFHTTSSSQPSNPSEGDEWYDSTNDVLKVYDGSQWNEVGAGNGDMLYADFNWVTKTGATITLDLNSEITPSANFTVNAPSTIKDGQIYVLRVINGATAYTMTLGTGITNPQSVATTLTASGTDQFVFLAVDGDLELQPISEGTTYTAGEGIDITNNEISVDTDVVQEKLTAGANITIEENCEWDTKGPAPSGFHVPTKDEWDALSLVLFTTFSLPSYSGTLRDYLKMPAAGYRRMGGNVSGQGTGYYWTSSASNSYNASRIAIEDSSVSVSNLARSNAASIRCFKNTPVAPDNSWTTLYDGSSVATGAGIFHNTTNGLISISGDGVTWYTIQDKNLGATEVFNGGTVTDANSGYYYQWGNNYGFPHSGTVTTSSTQVDASNYGPLNYYSSSTFITRSYEDSNFDWSSVSNDNLRGGVSKWQGCRTVISSTDTKYTAGTGIDITNNTISVDSTTLNGKVDKGVNTISQGATSLFSIDDGNWESTFGTEIKATQEVDANEHFDSGINPYGVYSEYVSSGGTVSAGIDYSGLGMRDGNSIRTSITPSEIQYRDEGPAWETNYFAFGGGGSNQIARLQDIKAYTAGAGIDITNDEISVDTDVIQEKLTAGTGIEISEGQICTTESDRKGPAPSGYHIPTSTEWGTAKSIWNTLGGGDYQGNAFGVALKLPKGGYRDNGTSGVTASNFGYYWSSSPGSLNSYAASLTFGGANPIASDGNASRARGMLLRAFKNTPVVPDNSWTKTYGTSILTGGIFRSSSLGLVSLSGDGSTWITMQDKNIGATTVWNDGDTVTQDNGGNFYQWGNNYGFPFTGSVTTSSTQVDASSYGPGNYYSSDVFITISSGTTYDRSISKNDDLWGNTSNSTHEECVVTPLTISSTVDGFNPTSTGITGQILTKTASGYDWGYASDLVNTKTFYLSSTSDLTNAQAAYDWYLAGNNPIIVHNNLAYSIDSLSPSVALIFTSNYRTESYNNSYTAIYSPAIQLNFSGDTVTSVTLNSQYERFGVISPNATYSTPYTPQYDGSPATKKYVDDNAGMKLAPNSPLNPKYQWFGTEAQYQALSQYYTDEANDTVYYTI